METLLGDAERFGLWQAATRDRYAARVNAVPLPALGAPAMVPFAADAEVRPYALKRVRLALPGVHEEYGGLLAVPAAPDPRKPLVLALHGHELPCWGAPPAPGFAPGAWMDALARAGYAVYAPVSMEHERVRALAEEHGYPVVWTRLAADSLDALESKARKTRFSRARPA